MLDHLVPLAGDWALWKTICLRGTGFPAARLLPLAARGIEESYAALEIRRLDASLAIDRALAACRRSEDRARGRALRKKLRAGRVPEVGRAPIELEETLAAARAALAARDAELTKLEEHLAAEERRISLELREAANDPRLREALAWQNHAVLHTAIEPLARASGTSSGVRQHELLIAGYLQRFAAKNDSIGFFGPIGWGALNDHDGNVLEPGPSLVSERAVYFEHWAIDALAAKLARDPAARPWLRPRRSPALRVEGDAVFDLFGDRVDLSSLATRLLAAADGARSARDLAAELVRAEQTPNIQDVYLALLELERSRYLTWTIEVPTEDAHPEAHLESSIDAIGDPAIRERLRAPLRQLLLMRAEVARAAGDHGAIDRSLRELEETFTRATRLSPARRAGETYAGRGLIYEDCRRDLTFELGRDVFRGVAPALSLVLAGARWLTWTLAERCRAVLAGSFRRMRAEAPGEQLFTFPRFWRDASRLVIGEGEEGSPIAAEVLADFTERWSRILPVPADLRSVTKTAAELAPGVAEHFSAPGPGWPLARYHSIDLQIAAPNMETIAGGRFSAILGELHAGVNGQLVPMFLRRHPRPEQLLSQHDRDVPEPCVAPVIGKDRFNRAELHSLSPRDFHVLSRDTPSWRPRERVVEIAELVIEEDGPSLRVRTRDGRFSRDIIAFIERYLIGAVLNRFRFLPEASHTPRIAIDDLIIARESWREPPQALEFALAKTARERFLGALAWAKARGLPRFVFFKIPEEPKPCYLDLSSPPFVELFARAVRKASRVSISEMLPAHDALWLTNAAGERHTSELRLTAVDPVAWKELGRT